MQFDKVDEVSINRQFLETGDERAFEHIFNTYYKVVYNTANKVVRNHEDAEEITNDTFIKAFNKREEIREPEKLLVWLRSTARNLAIDSIRRSRQQVRHLPIELFGILSDHQEDMRSASILAETSMKLNESNRSLAKQLLCLLSDRDREIVELIDELSPREIAEVIGSTAGAVQKRWERIIEWLRPVGIHLDALIDCLQEERDRRIMELYLDGQPLSVITKTIGVSDSTVERTVKCVIAQWRKASRLSPTNPVSAMANNEKQ